MSTDPTRLIRRMRHPFRARHVQLLARESVSPGFVRLTLGGPQLQDFTSAGFDDHVYVGLDCASDLPFDDTDGSLSVIFPTGAPKRPGDVSYLLARLRGQRMARVRLIFAPELRDAVVAAVEAECED